jgi:hypothetical protein
LLNFHEFLDFLFSGSWLDLAAYWCIIQIQTTWNQFLNHKSYHLIFISIKFLWYQEWRKNCIETLRSVRVLVNAKVNSQSILIIVIVSKENYVWRRLMKFQGFVSGIKWAASLRIGCNLKRAVGS